MSEFPIGATTSEWIERTLARLTLDQKIGQLLHPFIRPQDSPAGWAELLGGVEPGGVFLFTGTEKQYGAVTAWLRERSSIPPIVSSDLENGAGRMIEDATVFPDPMSLAATDSEEFAFEMGRATAVEARALGVHWSFAPVVDVSVNPYNPIVNTRSLGDDPDRIIRLATAMIRGMQRNGLCATVKHFPGDGFDDRDQHLCTTINPLDMEQWFALSGRVFQAAIDMGVWSVMIGHLSLPAWDPGGGGHVQDALPATLSRRIVTGLLREKMGFEGLVVTDAMEMAGVRSRGPQEEIVPAVVEAGCDMLLFCDVARDFPILKQAVESGRLAEARVDEAVRRILALKELLGLHEDRETSPPTVEDREHFRRVSRQIAEKAITVVKDSHHTLPLALGKGTRVLSFHLRGDRKYHVDAFDDLLRERGALVTRLDESVEGAGWLFLDGDEVRSHEVVIVSTVFGPTWATSRIRPAGDYMRDLWRLGNARHPCLVLVSYGSPYQLYEVPHVPVYVNAYSPDLNTQQAVLQVLTGELEATGRSPVDVERPYRFKSQGVLRSLLD